MARRRNERRAEMIKVLNKGYKQKVDESSVSRLSSARDMEELFLLEIERLQRQIKPESFRAKKKKRGN
jgi:hypothetical protein